MSFQRVAHLIALLLISCSFVWAKYELRDDALFDDENKIVTKDDYVKVLVFMSSNSQYNETIAEWLMENGLEVNAEDNLPIRLASDYSHSSLVAKLLNNPLVDPGANKNQAIRFAAQFGRTKIVQLLLNDSRVDPSANSNFAIRIASQNGLTEIVRLLLNHQSVDPSANKNQAIIDASCNGYYEIVQLLLHHEKVNPTANKNEPVQCASFNGHLRVVQLLLSDSRVDPSDNDNSAIQWASHGGYTEIVQLLLKDSRVDPSANNNRAIIWASEMGQAAVIELLLRNDKVNATQALEIAIEQENYGIVEIIHKARPELTIHETEKIKVETKLSFENNFLIIHYESLKDYEATFVLYSKNDSAIYLKVLNISKGNLSIELNKLSDMNWKWRWICAKQAIENTGQFQMDNSEMEGNNSTISDNVISEESNLPIWLIAVIVTSSVALVAIVIIVYLRIRSRRRQRNLARLRAFGNGKLHIFHIGSVESIEMRR